MKLRIGDFVVALVILALAAAIWAYPFFGSDGKDLTVSISQNGELVRSLPLIGTAEEIALSGCRVSVSDGKVSMLESECGDKVCIKTGKIHSAGEAIICVPNRVSVEISGRDGIDAVAG